MMAEIWLPLGLASLHAKLMAEPSLLAHDHFRVSQVARCWPMKNLARTQGSLLLLNMNQSAQAEALA